ncbi:hypothetical protein TRFO_11191 [Tritrichomonas foetus]|uniref:RING-type domain-containing protein n=1 Tax=Tritrichomonas foetus TaxID=1144522 RepID=A0A1J4J4T6_9EUKA|nr:hypothetical protein TRFO_11191 [Tritrichomonas foetus]|eukprot:OHS94334.1 hypothetical protein TRFO_11191 [Tritrichomonas foetus]
MNRRSRRKRASRRNNHHANSIANCSSTDQSVPLRFLTKPRAILKPNSPRFQGNHQKNVCFSLAANNENQIPIVPPPASNDIPIIPVSSIISIAPPSEPHSVSARRHYPNSNNVNNYVNYAPSSFPFCIDFDMIKSDIEKGQYVKQTCSFCQKHYSYKNLSILSCGHVFHSDCLSSFRKNSNPRNHCCPICRQLYHFVDIHASDCYKNLAAILIQKRFRGFRFRKHLGDIAPPGSTMHRKWVLSRAKNASVLLVDAIENQSDAVDAILASIDKELDWARSVMNAVEVQEKVIDWESVRMKIIQKGCGSCPICLREIYFDDCMITSCEHCYHPECLKHWLSVCENEDNATTCPVCRSPFQFRRLYEVGEIEFFCQYPDAKREAEFAIINSVSNFKVV